MRLLIFFTAISLAAVWTSCNCSAGSSRTKENAAADNTASPSSTAEAVFSYNLDGTKISGGEVDAASMNNAVFITPMPDKSKKFSFFLNDAYKGDAETFPHSLRFAIPGKTGTITLTADQDNFNVQLFLSTGENGKYILYANESFTITLTNISATRAAGTFSGKVKLVEGQGPGKGEFTITDGKFDIPIRITK